MQSLACHALTKWRTILPHTYMGYNRSVVSTVCSPCMGRRAPSIFLYDVIDRYQPEVRSMSHISDCEVILLTASHLAVCDEGAYKMPN